MCQKCDRYYRRYGTRDITHGQAKAMAIRMLKGEPIRLFCEKQDNIAVEAWAWRIGQARTRRKARSSE